MKKAGILGATGTVGQRFIQLLENHPEISIEVLGASQRSCGEKYVDACFWKLNTSIPEVVAGKVVVDCVPWFFTGCDVIFSGLDSNVAFEIEAQFRDAGFKVFSNAKNHRMFPTVPLVVPLVNLSHLDVLDANSGWIVTNANCTTTGLVVALKPLHDAFGISHIHVHTMQAISGAGYPGVPSLDILGNVVPFIDGEEEKVQIEPLKILGSFNGSEFENLSGVIIDSSCNRVPVINGHTENVSIKFSKKKPTIEEVINVLENYVSDAQNLNLFSAPKKAIRVLRNKDRPQPLLDLMHDNGFSISVGRIRKGNYWDLSFTLLVHNTILGAAGSAILNAEAAIAKKILNAK